MSCADSETNAFVKPYKVYESWCIKRRIPHDRIKFKSEQKNKTVNKQYNLQGTYEKNFHKHYIKH